MLGSKGHGPNSTEIRPPEKWRKEKEEKTLAKGKPSIVPAASLTYTLCGYKIIAESWQDTRPLEKKKNP